MQGLGFRVWGGGGGGGMGLRLVWCMGGTGPFGAQGRVFGLFLGV